MECRFDSDCPHQFPYQPSSAARLSNASGKLRYRPFSEHISCMTITQIRYIKSVGRYRNVFAQGDVTFKKFTLLFGENGRGKTTLCAILRSWQSNYPEI